MGELMYRSVVLLVGLAVERVLWALCSGNHAYVLRARAGGAALGIAPRIRWGVEGVKVGVVGKTSRALERSSIPLRSLPEVMVRQKKPHSRAGFLTQRDGFVYRGAMSTMANALWNGSDGGRARGLAGLRAGLPQDASPQELRVVHPRHAWPGSAGGPRNSRSAVTSPALNARRRSDACASASPSSSWTAAPRASSPLERLGGRANPNQLRATLRSASRRARTPTPGPSPARG